MQRGRRAGPRGRLVSKREWVLVAWIAAATLAFCSALAASIAMGVHSAIVQAFKSVDRRRADECEAEMEDLRDYLDSIRREDRA